MNEKIEPTEAIPEFFLLPSRNHLEGSRKAGHFRLKRKNRMPLRKSDEHMPLSRFNIKRLYHGLSGSDLIYPSDRVYGDRIIKLFEQLKEDRTVLKLNLLGKDYERLTIITGLIDENDTSYFLIDSPRDFRETLQDTGPHGTNEQRMAFEFIGSDKVPFAFRTVLDGVQGRDIRIKVPNYIKRIQRRGHFRIDPPAGTKIIFNRDTKRYENSVLNLSLGGALISPLDKPVPGTRLYPGETLRNIKLIAQKRVFKLRIEILKSVVRRAGKDAETGRRFYALRFMEIEKEDKNDLEKWLYRWQREVLRKRSLLTK